MRATYHQRSSYFFGRSFLSVRREHIHPTDDSTTSTATSQDRTEEYQHFQNRVKDLFTDLASSDDLLSASWILKLLNSFLLCYEEFRIVVLSNPNINAGPGVGGELLNRLLVDFSERAVKALDLCNAIRNGIDQIRQWEKQLEIVLVALGPDQRPLGEGHFRRAKKAFAEFAISMLDEKDAGGGVTSVFSLRNRSFGGHGTSTKVKVHCQSTAPAHSRSLSWSVSRSWSAARQLQAIGNNLVPPRTNEILATNGVAIPIHTMSTVLLLAMWTLVVAIPCQDRGIQVNFPIPKNSPWAAPALSLHHRILEESKRKETSHSNGLLKEIRRMENSAMNLMEITDALQFPLEDENEVEVRVGVRDLGQACDDARNGLDRLEAQVRKVFKTVVQGRTQRGFGFDGFVPVSTRLVNSCGQPNCKSKSS